MLGPPHIECGAHHEHMKGFWHYALSRMDKKLKTMTVKLVQKALRGSTRCPSQWLQGVGSLYCARSKVFHFIGRGPRIFSQTFRAPCKIRSGSSLIHAAVQRIHVSSIFVRVALRSVPGPKLVLLRKHTCDRWGKYSRPISRHILRSSTSVSRTSCS